MAVSRSLRMVSIPKRYWVTFFAFVVQFLITFMQSNLSIAVVEMTSNQTNGGNNTEFKKPEFDWNSSEKSYILGAFMFGVSFACVSGFVINKIGGAYVVAIGMIIMALLSALIPFLLRIHVIIFVISRALQGICDGFINCALVDVFAHWSPAAERTRLLSFATTGMPVSMAINYPLSGYIVGRFGWQAIFYSSGAIGLIWSFLWLIFIRNTPAHDKFISNAERQYILENIGETSEEKVLSTREAWHSKFDNPDMTIPWKSILLSTPALALVNEYFIIGWAPTFVTQYLPVYIKDVRQVNIQEVGLISSIPVIFGILTMPVAAYLADYLRSNGTSNSKVHKSYLFWGELVIIISLLSAALSGEFLVCIICFCFLQVAFSFTATTYSVICIDMAGQYAAVIKAICTTSFSAGSFLNTLVMGYIVRHKIQTEWNIYLFILCSVTMFGVVVFLRFGSGELQPWAMKSKHGDADQSNIRQNNIKLPL